MLSEVMRELTHLRLSPMAQRLAQWVEDPSNMDRPSIECVMALVEAQKQDNLVRRTRRFFNVADLPDNIALNGVRACAMRGLSAKLLGELATLDWIRKGHSVVITGAARTGKTYLAGALAKEAAAAGLSVAFCRTPEWLAEQARLRSEEKLSARLKRSRKARLLVLDDFAMERATEEQCHALRQLLDLRERHGLSTMVASPNAVEDWDGYFEDKVSADAIFGRLLGRAQLIVLKETPHAAAPGVRKRERSG